MPKLTPARALAATTSKDQIEPGTPEEAYQTINRAKMLWNFRRRDVDSWQEVINNWAAKPEAWNRIPEDRKPYGSPRPMIETELDTDYEQFKAFVRIVLGETYAAKIDEPYRDSPGNPTGANQHTDRNPYVRKDSSEEKQYGNTTAYLRQRIADEHPDALDNIGKGKEYKTVNEAARKLGVIPERVRLCMYIDDPAAAGRYLAQRVDREWFDTLIDAYYKSIDG